MLDGKAKMWDKWGEMWDINSVK